MSDPKADLKALIHAHIVANGEAPKELTITPTLFADLYILNDPEFQMGSVSDGQGGQMDAYFFSGTRIYIQQS